VNPRRLIIWALLLALAIGAYYYSGSRQERDTKAKDEQARLVTALSDPLNVASLEFKGSEVPKTMRIERQDDQQRWVLTEPVQGEADSLAVGRVIGALLEARFKERLTPKGPLADFGLEPPRLAVTLVDRQGAKAEVLVGDISPSKESLYVALPGAKEILLLPAALRGEVARTLFDLRSKTVLDFMVGQVRRVELKDGEETLVLERAPSEAGASAGAEASWTLASQKDGHSEASSKAVDDLLYQIHGLQATAILDEGINPARMGLENPVRRVTLTMADGSSLGLAVGGPLATTQETYVRRLEGGPVLVLKHESLTRIKRQPRDLLERRVLSFERDQAQGLGIEREEATQLYEKKDGRWQRLQPPGGGEEAGETASLFLWDLADLKWERLLTPQAAQGLDKPAAVITLTVAASAGREGSALKQTLILGRPQPGQEFVAAKVEGDPRIFGISPSFIGMIPSGAEQLPPAEGPGGAK
jgi:hypothetical protein